MEEYVDDKMVAMKDEIEKSVYVRMLGRFSVSFGDMPIHLERTNRTKTMHALQMLLYAGKKGVSSETMMESLFPSDHVADPANNLKVTISHLRKTIRNTCLSDVLKIEYRSGAYYINASVPIILDIHKFSSLLEKSVLSQEEELPSLLQAESLYGGDFLPHLNDIEWVMVITSLYREKYFSCIRRISSILQERKDWGQLLPIAGRAAVRYHLEEWHCLCIDCLLNMGQISAAREAYRRATRSLHEDMTYTGTRMAAMLQRLEECEKASGGKVEQMIGSLSESSSDERPYYCSYSSFIDLYRISSRVMPHRTQLSYLLIYTFADFNGKRIHNPIYIEQTFRVINHAINASLRNSDVYTSYGNEVYLLLLIDATHEDCVQMNHRIQKMYRTVHVPGIFLRCTIHKVGDEILSAITSHQWDSLVESSESILE